MITASNLGFPRVGARRELKKALENYWSGKSTEVDLLATGKSLRQKHWTQQKELGIQHIPSNDFSFYDQYANSAPSVRDGVALLDLTLIPLVQHEIAYREVGAVIYVGTDDARLLRVSANGKVDQLGGFDAVAGRDKWYAGSALINGQLVGPPLGIRSITATSDGTVLLANVHVGGIPRSTDGGVTWEPTIDVDSDVHEVCAHPIHPGIVIAAAAIGLCISRDSGATWTVEQEGLHASYCSAVAFSGNDILVAASESPFAARYYCCQPVF
jgi:hypothetical protein